MQQVDGMKVIDLTRGDLTGMMGMIHSEATTRCSNARLNGQKSAEAIVSRAKSGEGLNVERSLTVAGLVSNATKAANPTKVGTTCVK